MTYEVKAADSPQSFIPIEVGTPFTHKNGWSGVVLGNVRGDFGKHGILALDITSNRLTEYPVADITPTNISPGGNLRAVYVINQPVPVPATPPLKLGTIVLGVFLGQLLVGVLAFIALELAGVIR